MGTVTSAAALTRHGAPIPAPVLSAVRLLRVIAAAATCAAALAPLSVVGGSPALIAVLALAVATGPLARLVEGEEQRCLPWVMIIAADAAVLVASAVYA